MWCTICLTLHDTKTVQGLRAASNPLRFPTESYRFEKVKNHDIRGFHLHALTLETLHSAASVENLAIALRPAAVPQAKVLFRTVYVTVKKRTGDIFQKSLVVLQKANGVEYNVWYKTRKYCRTVKRFLARALRDVFAPTFFKARF